MGFIERLFRKKIKFDHNFWGKMIFVGDPQNPSLDDYFYCDKYFKPTDEKALIRLDAKATGTTLAQINFFKEIEASYNDIIKSIIPMMEEKMKNLKSDFKIVEIHDQFALDSIVIPISVSKPVNWELCFIYFMGRDELITVTMSDLEPKQIQIDDN